MIRSPPALLARASQPATHVYGKTRVAVSVAPFPSKNGYLRVRNRASATRSWDGILQRGVRRGKGISALIGSCRSIGNARLPNSPLKYIPIRISDGSNRILIVP
jgi:hypothetical protein